MLMKYLNKHFLNRSFFNISIRSRLLIYFISLVILPASVICFTVFNKSTSIITEKMNSTINGGFNMIESVFLQKLDNIYDLAQNIYLNYDVVRILSSDHPSSQMDIVNEMSTLDKILESYQVQNPGKSIIIPKLYIFNRPEYLMYSFSDKVSDAGVLEMEKWYLNMPAELKYKIVGLNRLTISSVTLDTIMIAKRLFGLNNVNIPYAGMLTINVDIDEFNNTLSSFKPSPNSTIFVLDGNTNVILSPDKSLLGKSMADKPYIRKIRSASGAAYNSMIEKVDGSDILVSYKKIESFNWVIVSLSPIHELNGELTAFNWNVGIVIAVCMIVALVLVLFLADNISYPIRKLAKSMSTIQNGNFDIKIDYKRNDEFRYLISMYKEMLHRIKELIDKLYLSEVRKKEAELKSLQAQINPHFLYNTLDSVNWMAMKNNVPDISTMVTSLSDFFRYSLSKGKDIISIGDEVKQVQSYLVIQGIRFKDKLEYIIDVPEEIRQFSTVKLIMQPIVENAIIHGIEKRRGKGTIRISGAKLDDYVEIYIEDNGIGANIQVLNAMLKDPASMDQSYGIRNVNERIKHTFGDIYGLNFKSNQTGGVTVTIKIPALTNSTEVSYVAHDNS